MGLWNWLCSQFDNSGIHESEFSNFTPRAIQTLALARKEADRLHHSFIGPEHILLGLIHLGQGVAFNVLQKLGLDLESVRQEVVNLSTPGSDQKRVGNIPYTSSVKQVLLIARKEAKALHHTYVGTEHLLLGLLQEDGIPMKILVKLEIEAGLTRQQILRELDPNFEV